MNFEIRHTIPRFIEAMRRAPDVVFGEVDLMVERVAGEGMREARSGAPKGGTSTLTDSITPKRLGQMHHAFIAQAGYSRFVEEGTGPGGFPPIESIRTWMRTVGITPRGGQDERSTAFLIARKIFRQGTPAQPFMAPARETSIQRMQALLPDALRRGTERALS